jgi:mono/diheme cytochrome c family protein
MSNETLFYICGIVLAVSAVVVSFVGLKSKDFPGKAMPVVVIWFAIFVVGSATFAVLHAKDEEAHKAKELEEAGEKAEDESQDDIAPEGTEGAQGGESEKSEEEVEGGEGVEEEAGPEEAAPEGEEAMGEEGAEASAGGDAEAGKTVFAEQCSVCHGSHGHGGNGGPDLTTMPLAQTEEGAIEQVTNGGGGMPAFEGTLSEEEIANVAAYVSSEIAG